VEERESAQRRGGKYQLRPSVTARSRSDRIHFLKDGRKINLSLLKEGKGVSSPPLITDGWGEAGIARFAQLKEGISFWGGGEEGNVNRGRIFGRGTRKSRGETRGTQTVVLGGGGGGGGGGWGLKELSRIIVMDRVEGGFIRRKRGRLVLQGR